MKKLSREEASEPLSILKKMLQRLSTGELQEKKIQFAQPIALGITKALVKERQNCKKEG